MTKLSVNINKVALLRNARGGNLPNLLQVAKDCIAYGADGITVHPRPDERHIRKTDVYALAELLKDYPTIEYNIEGYPSKEFIDLVHAVRPTQCTLVPDAPNALTSDTGWDTLQHQALLTEVVAVLHEIGVRVALFVAANTEMISGAAHINADRIELYTGPYAATFAQDPNHIPTDYQLAADFATALGLGVNAGHDLNLHNLKHLITSVDNIAEVSIGHALISDALYLGLAQTIQAYKACLIR